MELLLIFSLAGFQTIHILHQGLTFLLLLLLQSCTAGPQLLLSATDILLKLFDFQTSELELIREPKAILERVLKLELKL